MTPVDKLLERAIALAPKVCAGAGMFLIFCVVGIVIKRIVSRAERRIDPAKQDVLNLLGQTCEIVLVILGIITGLGTIGINVSALVAGLGLTGFALGFAFRDSLSNVLAGLVILTYHPFRRNDHIAVTAFEGKVREVNLRYTVLDTAEKEYLIPNSLLINNPITKWTPKSSE